jgi:hypothetical protein
MEGCHVENHDWATWHHKTCLQDDMCQNMIHPSTTESAESGFQLICHIIVRSYDLYGHLPCQHCTDCTVSKILPIWKNEQNMISCSYDVRLSPFKLCWVHNNEAYAHVHFEGIPSTFIFEQNLIPWIN